MPQPGRGIFCNRTLNLRRVVAIGYDMDYTLIHYNIKAAEKHAYEHIKKRLLRYKWPIAGLKFDHDFLIRGLHIDTKLGNIVKANRFGFVKVGYHGMKRIDYDALRKIYKRTVISLDDERFALLNTFFTLSEACLFAQLVELFDKRRLPGASSYKDIYDRVRSHIDAVYLEGVLKPAIFADPEKFIDVDPGAALVLQDQVAAGKKLLLITNSDWNYTNALMSYAYDPYLPKGVTWRKLFSLVIVSADKPTFFSARNKLFEVIDLKEGMLKPAIKGLNTTGVFLGGHSKLVENFLGLSGDEILYVGDHVIGDVQITKEILRWRTALICRELEDEMAAIEAFRPQQEKLFALREEKERLEQQYAQMRLAQLRSKKKYGPEMRPDLKNMKKTVAEIRRIDRKILPIADRAHELSNKTWGLSMRTGNDKSYLAHLVEQYADIYMSRVSNMLDQTPYFFLRSSFVTMPHDSVADNS